MLNSFIFDLFFLSSAMSKVTYENTIKHRHSLLENVLNISQCITLLRVFLDSITL
jgi:hypothetical protein